MNAEILDLWERAGRTLKTASAHIEDDPDTVASRAYYAAFYAVSALFALREKNFSKHSAVESAVHKELVKTGLWKKSLGSDYSWLVNIRDTGDYGGKLHVSPEEAKQAIQKAQGILEAVHKENPDIFILD